jgi:hypothetical protein
MKHKCDVAKSWIVDEHDKLEKQVLAVPDNFKRNLQDCAPI